MQAKALGGLLVGAATIIGTVVAVIDSCSGQGEKKSPELVESLPGPVPKASDAKSALRPAPPPLLISNPVALTCGATITIGGALSAPPPAGAEALLKDRNSDCVTGRDLLLEVQLCPQTSGTLSEVTVRFNDKFVSRSVMVRVADAQGRAWRPILDKSGLGRSDYQMKVRGAPVTGVGTMQVEARGKKDAEITVCSVSAKQ